MSSLRILQPQKWEQRQFVVGAFHVLISHVERIIQYYNCLKDNEKQCNRGKDRT